MNVSFVAFGERYHCEPGCHCRTCLMFEVMRRGGSVKIRSETSYLMPEGQKVSEEDVRAWLGWEENQ